ncbi:MAG TPA: hypothetical protein VN426_05545 [Syntrophomonadaceae bacterium]|nr:hypothetical protein [Syntrophomonadaceae bacterium]
MRKSVSVIGLLVLLIMVGLLSGCAGNNATVDSKTTANVPKTPKELVIGKWTTAGGSMEFNEKGVATSIENGEKKQFSYKLAAIEGSKDSVTITINDSGSESSETAVFKDENTMVIGDTSFKRANAAKAKESKGAAAVEETKTFSNPDYRVTFQYPASMRLDLMDNSTIRLTSTKGDTINDSYFIRCEQKFVQDSKKLGLTNEGTAKSFIKISVDNLKKIGDAISNYNESSSTDSDGSAIAEAVFNAQTSSGYGKMRIEVMVAGDYMLATTLWSGEKSYDNALKELTSITDTLDLIQ